MADVLTPEQRRLNMSRIRGKDTKPEMLVRRGLHAQGFRYRLHDRSLPGRPDLVFPKYKAIVFVHGCFWHAHRCALSKLPETRQDFWQKKLAANLARDHASVNLLIADGWRVLVIWECAFRGARRGKASDVLERVANFVQGTDSRLLQIPSASCQVIAQPLPVNLRTSATEPEHRAPEICTTLKRPLHPSAVSPR